MCHEPFPRVKCLPPVPRPIPKISCTGCQPSTAPNGGAIDDCQSCDLAPGPQVGMRSRLDLSSFLPTLFESFLRETWEEVSSELVTLGKSLPAHGDGEPTVKRGAEVRQTEETQPDLLQPAASGAPRHPFPPHVFTNQSIPLCAQTNSNQISVICNQEH